MLASLLFVLLTFGLLGSIMYGLYYALQKAAWKTGQRNKVMLYTFSGFVLWLAFTGIVAANGFFLQFSAMPPRLLLVLVPPLIFIVVLSFSAPFGRLLQQIPASWLIYIQSFRIVIEIILWMAFVDQVIPVQMTFEGRNFDILAGLTAPVIAYFCFVRKVWPVKIAIAWNIAGLILLANIVIVAILSAPGPFRVFMNEPANTFIAHLPFVWLPGFVVPVAYWMHILSLKQLLFASKKDNNLVINGNYMPS